MKRPRNFSDVPNAGGGDVVEGATDTAAVHPFLLHDEPVQVVRAQHLYKQETA